MRMRMAGLVLAAAGVMLVVSGCVSAKAPERIDIRMGGGRPTPVDTSRVPHPSTLAEAQRELNAAYANLQHFEREVAHLERKAAKYKRERNECERRLERYEDD